ncbi:L-rhamnose isomerase [Ktedonospora formicarum]|uniref:L-rhamnose isomerase n=1 Tax=Ktedonospora formicarum TaxID=2778364 RepID=A0A8J3MX59_9CHLR|nr:L-rhamnose isomerase [Ktedonospora formicarum]GHO48230.1 L-rhamnose isomerase [Ktedonospora formicarum]
MNTYFDKDMVLEEIRSFRVETPSWGYGDSGTRFKVFHWPGAARNLREKLEDAAMVQKVTGICPSVALHIPWDKEDDWSEAKAYAESLGLRLGAVNPNLFQDDEYRFGSLCHYDPAVRRAAIEHILECVEIARTIGSDTISLWLADGTNYPGQDNLRARKRRLRETLSEIYPALGSDLRLLIEYKFFEPAFYHTDLADWGMASTLARQLGPQAKVLVDTGHHAQGTNIAHIVSYLIDEEQLGGFHFNDRRYADDDLIVGSQNPFDLFLIFTELVAAAREGVIPRVDYMIDQSHNLEPKVEAMIQSILHIQSAHTRALLVNYAALAQAQAAGDTLAAYRVLRDAFETDVRPLLAEARESMGLDPDPIRAFRASGYAERVARERPQAAGGASGYPGA